ncbi:MAG: hypothetical protein ACE5E6_03675 [Phycisphaerae bacterium]
MRRNTTAFTLVEVVVVLGVVTLLVSILLPALSGARDGAKATVCLANLKRLGASTAVYVTTYRDRFFPFRLKHGTPGEDVVYVNAFGRAKPRWQWFLAADDIGPVIDPGPFGDEIAASGSFGDGSIGVRGASGRVMTNRHFLCPSLTGTYELDVRNGAYGYNYQYLGNARQDDDAAAWDNFPVASRWIRAASRTVLIADSRGAGRRHGRHAYALDPPRLALERNAHRFGPGPSDVPAGLDPRGYAYSPVEMRHRGHGNTGFVDGHAEPLTREQLGYAVGDGVATPVWDLGAAATASNRLWTGVGMDPIAARPTPGG